MDPLAFLRAQQLGGAQWRMSVRVLARYDNGAFVVALLQSLVVNEMVSPKWHNREY